MVLSLLMLVFWIMGMMIGNVIFPSSMMEAAEESGGGISEMLAVCALNTLAVLILVYNSKVKGLKLAGIIILMVFGIQFFMSQIETLWFNEAVNFPLAGIWAVVFGGFVMAVLFSGSAIWMTRGLKSVNHSMDSPTIQVRSDLIMRVAFLAVIAYPAIYFLAGYFIAWQFADVRVYYTSVTELTGFFPVMWENLKSGLYAFQIFRGILWILIALPAILVLNANAIQKGLIIGLLFSFLGGMQLLIPNPFMPEMVRFAHLVETVSSNFLWGFLIGWSIDKVVQTQRRVPLAQI